jgi:hypothetical protein
LPSLHDTPVLGDHELVETEVLHDWHVFEELIAPFA